MAPPRGGRRRRSFRPAGRPRPRSRGGSRGPRRPAPAPDATAAERSAVATAVIPRTVAVPERVSVRELAELLRVGPPVVLKELLGAGLVATVNRELDRAAASLVARNLGFRVEEADAANGAATAATTAPAEAPPEPAEPEPDTDTDLPPRPPVVAVMGHVDHGKTSILDALRESQVATGEAGGITQHIGAYQVEHDDRTITFLDTPGHEAFTALRARGAAVTDLAILVVAADDGVQPQTVEAISHLRAAKTPFLIAMNKIDLPSADPDRLRQQLTEHEVVVEDYGGDVVAVPVSATTHEGLDDLLEMVNLVAELEELRATPDGPAEGTVIETRLDRSQGPVATVIIASGTLHVGDHAVAGEAGGRVRALLDEHGRRLRSADPAQPVEVLGWNELPNPGDRLEIIENDRAVRAVTAARKEARQQRAPEAPRRSIEDLLAQLSPDQAQELPVVLKADVHGSLEAIQAALAKLETDEAKVHILYGAVGRITEGDVNLAAASDGVILAFNTQTPAPVRRLADQQDVLVRSYNVIYNLLEDVEQTLRALVEPEVREVVLGHAEIRAIFRASRARSVVGCYVQDGLIRQGARARVVRRDAEVYNGRVASLRRFKDDVDTVEEGYECGIGLENFADPQNGDVIEIYGRAAA